MPGYSTIIPLEERRPLNETARRNGWIGCNILLDRLPPDGWIEISKDGRVRSPGVVRDKWRRFSILRESTVRSRGGMSDVLGCVRKLGREEFSLQEMYDFEEDLRALHPKNRHIRSKIRQLLYVLLETRTVGFAGDGCVNSRLVKRLMHQFSCLLTTIRESLRRKRPLLSTSRVFYLLLPPRPLTQFLQRIELFLFTTQPLHTTFLHISQG